MAITAQDLCFCPRRIILGKLRDILEQLRASIIIKPARRDRFLRLLEAREHVGAKSRIDAFFV